MRRHWSEVLTCPCGATFRTASAEARHRHAFPAYCRAPRRYKGRPKGEPGTFTRRKSRAKAPADHIAEAGKMVPA
jgi:hypothetical protein